MDATTSDTYIDGAHRNTYKEMIRVGTAVLRPIPIEVQTRHTGLKRLLYIVARLQKGRDEKWYITCGGIWHGTIGGLPADSCTTVHSLLGKRIRPFAASWCSEDIILSTCKGDSWIIQDMHNKYWGTYHRQIRTCCCRLETWGCLPGLTQRRLCCYPGFGSSRASAWSLWRRH